MRKSLFSTICFCILTGFFMTASAQRGAIGTKTITTAAPFLSIGPDARAGGMGEVGVAVADDANALHWNPSALAFTESSMGFSMSYSPWLRSLNIPDINLAYLAGFYKTGENGVIGASLRYFSLGTIEFTDFDANKIGEDKPNEFALDLAYALKVSDQLSAAVSLRYFHSKLASDASLNPDLRAVNSIAGDFSFLYKKDFSMASAGADLPVTFTAGLHVSNIGPKVSYNSSNSNTDFIPINLRFGYAFKFQLDEYNSVTFANDFNKLLVPSVSGIGQGAADQSLLSGIFGSFGDADGGFSEEISEINTSLGLEYWYRELFSARIGFFYEDPQKGNRKFITLGAGVKYNVFGLHFSYLAPLEQNHPLQNTLRFALIYNFDADE